MPRAWARAGATGDAGGAAGGKEQSTEAQSNTRAKARDGVKKDAVTQSRTQKPQFYVQPSSDFCWIPPVVRRLFEVNSEPHTGARPSVRLCVGLIKPIIFTLLRRTSAELFFSCCESVAALASANCNEQVAEANITAPAHTQRALHGAQISRGKIGKITLFSCSRYTRACDQHFLFPVPNSH
jgi:hypothetical protein